MSVEKIKLEVQNLHSEVKKLITPAVAGSLSAAFEARKDILFRGRIGWLIILLIVSVLSIIETKDLATSFSNVLLEIQKTKQPINLLWESLILRLTILLPLYIAFGVSFYQYKKERDYEEEYAHKAAVAISLPNYGDLTREPAVRDQIVSAATNVIFSTPTNKKTETEVSDKALKYMKEVLASIAKLLPRKD